MPEAARRPRVALLVAALAAALAATALAAPPSDARIRREDVKAMLAAELEARGLNVKNVSVCEPRHRFDVYVCNWRAEGNLPGGVPYRCAGQARYTVAERSWRIERCRNMLLPRIPLTEEPGPHPLFGYNDGWSDLGVQWLDMLRASSAVVAREGLAWRGVEGSRGNFDWQRYDQIYGQMLDRGIRPIFGLISAPCWAQGKPARCRRGKDQIHPSPSHYDEFARFAALAAQRYPLALGLEVWNEPNWKVFWGGKPDPRAYGQMFKAAARAIHEANPQMPVLTAGLSPHANTSRQATAFPRFLKRIYKSGAAKLADAISAHPLPSVSYRGGYIDRVRMQLGQIQRVMSRHHDRSTPIWVTETGVSTTGSEPYSQVEQAKALVDIYTTLRRVHNLPVVVFHRFRDAPGEKAKEAGWGVVTSSGQRKPAFCAIAAARGSPC
jgi:polysaccharide biosynthesis protein PslG